MAAGTLLPAPDVLVHSPVTESTPPGTRRVRDRGYFSTALGGTPWKVGDVVRLATRQALALMGLVLAWVGCSGSLDFRAQAGWTAGAVLALVIGASGGVAWVLSGLGSVGRERRLVSQQIRALHLPRVSDAGADEGGLVTALGMRRFHRADCDVVKGKDVWPIDSDTSVDLKPCGMCMS